MKLIGLNIQKLHGCYNYNIKFNSDVTFIFGTNGCGKTTVLNITEAIITGQLFKLFDYVFSSIQLVYSKKDGTSENVISLQRDNATAINVKYNGKSFCMEKIADADEIRNREPYSAIEKVRAYFERYESLAEIKNTFNYVYLPLNRATIVTDSDEEYMMMRRMRNRQSFVKNVFSEPNVRDTSMLRIESLKSSTTS